MFGYRVQCQMLVQVAPPLMLRNINVSGNHELWPVTMIESQATINYALGGREAWRKAEIVSDATLAIVEKPPALRTSRSTMIRATA